MFDMNRKGWGGETSIDRCPLLLQVIYHVKQPRHDTIKGYQFSATGYKIISFTKLLCLVNFLRLFLFSGIKTCFITANVCVVGEAL